MDRQQRCDGGEQHHLDVYDVAVTLQGEQENDFIGWKNVHVKNNRITRCSQSFEVWSRGEQPELGAGYVNCSFTGNNCTDAGIGSWGYEARPNKDEGGVHLLAYNEELPMELSITGNRFIGAKNAYMYRLTEGKSRMVIDNNEIELAAGQRLQQPRPRRSRSSGKRPSNSMRRGRTRLGSTRTAPSRSLDPTTESWAWWARSPKRRPTGHAAKVSRKGIAAVSAIRLT